MVSTNRGKNGVVVVVDGFSSGAFYAPLLAERKAPAVHVCSIAGDGDSFYDHVAVSALARFGHLYAALIDGAQPLEALRAQLEEHAPRAVLAGSEGGVELASRLARELGLPGNDPDLSAACRDKFLMHQTLASAGLAALDGALVHDAEQAQAWARERGCFPVVLKPARSSGADQVHICQDADQVRDAFNAMRGARSLFGERIATALVQAFAQGEEVVVNSVSHQGRHRVTDLWRYNKLLTQDGRSVYEGSELVADFGGDTAAVIAYAFAVLDALGIRQGPAHMEIMLTAQGPVLIECGARPMGGSFPQDLLRECLGQTQLEWSLDAALEPAHFLSQCDQPYRLRKHFMVKSLVSTRDGALDGIPAMSMLGSLASVRAGNFLSAVEHWQVQRTVDLGTSPAHLYLCHADRDLMHQDAALVRALEQDAPNLLFELKPRADTPFDQDWFKLVPDDLWLKGEDEAQADGDRVLHLIDPRPGMDILDCPCGDGRIGIHLARRGANVTGIDINARFIDGARRRFADAGLEGHFAVGDMRELAWQERFDAVVNWFNSFGYFDVETDFDVLRRLRAALRPGGVLLIEAPNRGNVIANTRCKVDATTGEEFQRHWDALTERLYMPVKVDQHGARREVFTGARLYSLEEYRFMIQLAGLELTSVYNEALEPFNQNAKRILLLARRNG
jgi:biotin carboxylase/2-polyprenyl-3-methyl-5-hydroxy-6-metoxy-1,4-benzoquinol methylase